MIAIKDEGALWQNAGLMLAFAGGSAGCSIAIGVLASFISSSFATRVREALNEKILSFSLAELDRFSTASLITRVTNDVQQVQFTLVIAFRMFFSSPVMIVWSIIKIQSLSWELTAVTGVGIGILAVGISLIMALLIPKFKVIQSLTDRLNLLTRENLQGIRVIRAFNAEDYQLSKSEETNSKLTKINIFASRLDAAFDPLLMLVMDGISLGIYWVGAYLIAGQRIDYAAIAAYSTLSSMIVMSILSLLFMFVMFPRAQVSANRINEVLRSTSLIKESDNPVAPKEKGTIAFKHVYFSYGDAASDVLTDLDFSIEKGQTLAFVGGTGSGKSTVARLLLRLYDASKGSVYIDGVDIKDLKLDDLHKIVVSVPQKATLFSGTVKENIALSDPNLTMEEIEKAAKVACASSFVEEMEKGYDSLLSQGGTNVSGGQRQRLCIARAIASKGEIIVFDDSFSALDFKTDKEVRQNLKEALSDVTKVIIAQRIGTIMDADKIVVLKEGKVMGIGKHEELLSSCEEYRLIALSQLSKEELGL